MVTVHYIGDSTVARNNIHSYPQTGMSQGLSLYLKETVTVRSYAKNGRSTKSFLDEGRFGPVEAAMEPGDFLFIQFGHNDEKDDPARHTDPETTFRENLLLFIRSARERGRCAGKSTSSPREAACSASKRSCLWAMISRLSTDRGAKA